MTHNHRKPYIPLPPGLPRFALPNEGANEGADGSDDELDVALTVERPAYRAAARRVVRRIRPRLDQTSEVAAEDILLEVYAEDPPPPPSRQAPPLPPSASIRILPHPAQSAAVDALLLASDPAFVPRPPPQGQGYVGVGPDFESNSVAPVMMASTVPPPAPPARPIIGRRVNRSAVVAVWSVVLLVIGVAAGAAVVLGIQNGTYEQLRERAMPATPSTPVATAAAAAAPVPELAPTAPIAAPPLPPPPAPSIDVASLPKSEIASDVALVTFPSAAQGHRVFVDGRLVTVADTTATPIKCGRHLIKIGTARRARVVDLPCGREVTLP